MKSLPILGPIVIGAILLLYVFTLSGIASNHSVQNYLVMCTGIMSINFGLLAAAFLGDRK